MKKKQLKYQNYGFWINGNSPVDGKSRINSLSTLETEIPLDERYSGLIFYVNNISTFYCFLNNLTLPKPLKESILVTEITGISVPTENYTDLLDVLSLLNPKLGSLISIFPLGVTFKFNGTEWKYAFGDYKSNDLLFTMPQELLGVGKKVINPSGTIFIINKDKSISPLVIEATELPAQLENERYYDINGSLYYVINNVPYLFGKSFYFNDKILTPGVTNIIHNLSSSYICVKFWINSISEFIDINYTTIDSNTIEIKNSFDVSITGKLLITNLI